MKISILTPDLSHNCLGRAYLLAKILQRHYEVEIVGPIFGDGIWKPLQADDVLYETLPSTNLLTFAFRIRKCLKKISGDVLYVSKPLFSSYDVGLVRKWLSKRPLVLDVDDWELGGFTDYKNARSSNLRRRIRFFLAASVKALLRPDGSYWWVLFNEKLMRFADKLTISNRFLQRRFGGQLIWHARDTTLFHPRKFDKNLMREKYKIRKNKKIVMFFGTPRSHKGIEDLIEAISLLQKQEIMLTLVGMGKDDYSQNLIKLGDGKLGERFRFFGFQSFQKVPEFLAMADIVVIPQKRNFATVGQTPAKVFDAMAMAKPIIATNVSDLPEILDGCGWIVEPENSKKLAETIQYVFDHSEEARETGWKARQKCIEKYSWDAMEKSLVEIFKKYE